MRTRSLSNMHFGVTGIENMIISEYLVGLNEDEIKVYLYALMLSNTKEEFYISDIARGLRGDEKAIRKSLKSLKDSGLITFDKDILTEDPKIISFISVADEFYFGSSDKTVENNASRCDDNTSSDSKACHAEKILDKNPDNNADQAYDSTKEELFNRIEKLTGTTLSTQSLKGINSFLEKNMEPAVIEKAFEKAFEREITNWKYVKAILRDWYDSGIMDINTLSTVEEIDGSRQRQYKSILKRLGITNYFNPSDAQKEVIDKWLDKYGLTEEKILNYGRKMENTYNKNINYLDKIIKTEIKAHEITAEDVKKYIKSVIYERSINRWREKQKIIERDVEGYKNIAKKLNELRALESKMMFSEDDNKKAKMAKIQEERINLLKKRDQLLKKSGFTADDLEIQYSCMKCKDSGVLPSGWRCSCVKEKYKEAENWYRMRDQKIKNFKG